MENENYKLGEIAYNAYAHTRNWKTWNNEEMRKFEDMPLDFIISWSEAGAAVKNYVLQ